MILCSSNIKMVKFNFRGHMVPVFTPFNSDKERTLNIGIIKDYSRYLAEHGIQGVLVNGTSGEGMSMTIQERKHVTEEWAKACKKFKQTLMVQVGGAPLPDVLQLARHAEQHKADAILCLPELYFKPKTVDELITYIKIVSDEAPSTPILYYHIPSFSNVNLSMVEFLKKGYPKIKNLVGIKFTSTDLVEGSECLKICHNKYAVFLGADQLMAPAYTMGFDSAIATSMNIFPKIAANILFNIKSTKEEIENAFVNQKLLTTHVNNIVKHGSWVSTMKTAMNFTSPIQVGPVRFPLEELSDDQKCQIKKDIKE